MTTHPLAREIFIILALKVFALLVIFVLFFAPDKRPDITPDAVADQLLHPQSQSKEQ